MNFRISGHPTRGCEPKVISRLVFGAMARRPPRWVLWALLAVASVALPLWALRSARPARKRAVPLRGVHVERPSAADAATADRAAAPPSSESRPQTDQPLTAAKKSGGVSQLAHTDGSASVDVEQEVAEDALRRVAAKS
eukprot:5839293-Prymnesium_polylepis.1